MLQQDQNEEVDIYDEDIEIPIDKYNDNIKHELLSKIPSLNLLLSESDNKNLISLRDCSLDIIQYVEISCVIDNIILKNRYSYYYISCFLTSLLYNNLTTNYFRNHGINFIEVMKALGKKEDDILNGYERSLDKYEIDSMYIYLTRVLNVKMDKNTTIKNIIHGIFDIKDRKAILEFEDLMNKINPEVKIGTKFLNTVKRYNKNYKKELHVKKYNEVFGNVSENTFKCIKYAYEIYCEVLNGPIEKLANKRQELDKLSLIAAFVEKINIENVGIKGFIKNGFKKYIDAKPDSKEKLTIKDLDEISNIYGKYMKDENGTNLDAVDIFNNLIHEYNID